MRKIVLISKDAVSKNYLPVYFNKYWDTPNINALAEKGTIYNRHYTVAASTAMAFYSMISEENCYSTECKDYGDEQPFYGKTIFDKFKEQGYNTYLIWDSSYSAFARTHLKIIEGRTNVLELNIIPTIPPHIQGIFDDLTFDSKASDKALNDIKSTFLELGNKDEDAFIWIHLPHVLSGRNSYASDIDLFDQVVGYGREIFGDDSIFVSTDHGNMDGKNGKFGYGFDVEESAICIPLITPRIIDTSEVDFLTSNIHLFEILTGVPVKEDFIVCDTAYYCQPKRKMAILHGKYKLVYTKETKRFSLYDLKWDPEEKYNLYYPEFYDIDRQSWYSLNQRFFYPYWDEADSEKKLLKNKFDEIWKNGPILIEKKNLLKLKLKYLYLSLTKKKRVRTFKNVGK